MHNFGRRSCVATLVAVMAVVAGNAAIAEEAKQPQQPAAAPDGDKPSAPPPVVNQGQAPVAAAPARPRTSGFVALPYLGINSLSGDGFSNTSTGLRAGALLGGRVTEIFSINGEMTLDAPGVDAPGASLYIFHLALSPLFHVDTPSVQFVAGPKVGIWGSSFNQSIGGSSFGLRGAGWTLGLNAGVFVPIKNKISLGALLSYANLSPLVMCTRGTGVDEMCTGDNLQSSQVLGLTLGALL